MIRKNSSISHSLSIITNYVLSYFISSSVYFLRILQLNVNQIHHNTIVAYANLLAKSISLTLSCLESFQSSSNAILDSSWMTPIHVDSLNSWLQIHHRDLSKYSSSMHGDGMDVNMMISQALHVNLVLFSAVDALINLMSLSLHILITSYPHDAHNFLRIIQTTVSRPLGDIATKCATICLAVTSNSSKPDNNSADNENDPHESATNTARNTERNMSDHAAITLRLCTMWKISHGVYQILCQILRCDVIEWTATCRQISLSNQSLINLSHFINTLNQQHQIASFLYSLSETVVALADKHIVRSCLFPTTYHLHVYSSTHGFWRR